MAESFTRAQIDAMPAEERVRRIDELNAWAAAGAVDGKAAPDIRRPDGHTFTQAEIEGMSVEEFEANKDAIDVQLAAGREW